MATLSRDSVATTPFAVVDGEDVLGGRLWRRSAFMGVTTMTRSTPRRSRRRATYIVFYGDYLYGEAGDDVLHGWGGNDRLEGGADADTLDGGGGSDTADYYSSTARVVVSLSTGAASGGDATGDTFISIENVRGSAYADSIDGDDGANELYGLGDSDTLKGLGGADTLYGGTGDDFLYGWEADDTLYGDDGADQLSGGSGSDTAAYGTSGAAVTISLLNGTASGGDAAGDRFELDRKPVGHSLFGYAHRRQRGRTYFPVSAAATPSTVQGGDDTLHGGDGEDVLNGGANNDVLNGGAGADVLSGSSGFDRVDYSYSTAAVTVNLTAQTASGGHAQGDTLSSIETRPARRIAMCLSAIPQTICCKVSVTTIF